MFRLADIRASRRFGPILIVLACIAADSRGTIADDGSAAPSRFLPPVAMRTHAEQARELDGTIGLSRATHPRWSAPEISARSPSPLQMIEGTIRQANAGETFFRRPVPLSDVLRLRNSLAEIGVELTPEQAQAAIDYAQSLLRESPSKTLGAKVAEMSPNRKAFHGNVAELAEARAREMVLTKSPRSETFDLTEAKLRPHRPDEGVQR